MNLCLNDRAVCVDTYWSGYIPYSGPELSISDLIRGAQLIREELLSIAISNIGDRSIKNRAFIEQALCLSLFRKDFLLPKLNSFIGNDLCFTLPIDYLLNKFYPVKNVTVTNCCPPTVERGISYHDLIAHRLIDPLVDSPSYEGNINTHYIFGSLLRPLFEKYLYEGMNRLEILRYMVKDLVEYFRGERSLLDKKGIISNPQRLGVKEAEQIRLNHYRELATSYYQTYMYRRYDPSRRYGEDRLSDDLNERLNQVIVMRFSTIYEDSFYIRDEAIQRALKEIVNGEF